jgi:hypothetical protein
VAKTPVILTHGVRSDGGERAAYYTTSPARELLVPLVDFDVCNSHRIRLML